MGEAEAEMTNEKPLGRSRPSSRPHVRAVGQWNGESYDKRSPDRETKRAILDHDSQWSAVERHWREGRQSRSGLSVWRARAVTRESATADRGAAAAALTPFTHRIYRARSRPAGDRTPCFLPTRLLKSPPTSPPSNSTRTPPRSTFDVGAQPGQDLRPALMAFARGLAHEA